MSVVRLSPYVRAHQALFASCCPVCRGTGSGVLGWWENECSHGVMRGNCAVCTGAVTPDDQEWDKEWAPADKMPDRECAACKGSGFKDGTIARLRFGAPE